MKINEDFAQISTDFEPLPAEAYRVRIVEIEEKETKENKLPALNFELEVTEGEYEGRKLFDHVTLKQKDGAPNKIGLGRVKAYTQAILGEEAASGGAIDTDELKGGTCEVVVVLEPYTPTGGGEQRMSNKIKKVLPLG